MALRGGPSSTTPSAVGDVAGEKPTFLTEADIGIKDALSSLAYRRALLSLAIIMLLALAITIWAPIYVLVSMAATVLLGAATFVVARHVTISRGKSERRDSIWAATSDKSLDPQTGELPAVYYTYILGSGGHTGEMYEFVKRTYQGGENLHRRYLVTSGDTHSPHIVAKLESTIRRSARGQPTGTYDVIRVARARDVHQPLWTAVFTSIFSAFSIVAALVQEPDSRPREKFGMAYRCPHVIVTNGPGTGFIVCLMAHILKILFIVPSNRMKLLYMETWAHISTLSMTGKLFYYSDIADLFLVQHKQLADRIGKPCLTLFSAPSFAHRQTAEKC